MVVGESRPDVTQDRGADQRADSEHRPQRYTAGLTLRVAAKLTVERAELFNVALVTLDVGGGTKLRIIKNQVAGQWKATEPAATEAKK